MTVENVIDHDELVGRNLELWKQLEQRGQTPTTVLLHDCVLEVIVGLLCESEEAQEHFQLLVDMKINLRLKAQLTAMLTQ